MPFRAVHTDTTADVILSDDVDADALQAIRLDGRQGRLVCPVCRTPMHVRAGDVYAPHFAHAHRIDCPAGDDTPELRAARLALYRWLKPKVEARGGAVTIEDWTDGAGLPRPIDLLARFDDDKPDIAFWLHDRNLAPDARIAILRALLALGLQPCWLFIARLHRPYAGATASVTLSPTGRERMARTRYDALGPGSGAVHYLVADNTRLITYRSLSLVHAPGTYAATVAEDDVADVLLTRTGTLVHPEEMEALADYEAAPVSSASAWGNLGSDDYESPHSVSRSPAPTPASPSVPDVATCCICGHVRRWVVRQPVTDRTKCRACVGSPWPVEPS